MEAERAAAKKFLYANLYNSPAWKRRMRTRTDVVEGSSPHLWPTRV